MIPDFLINVFEQLGRVSNNKNNSGLLATPSTLIGSNNRGVSSLFRSAAAHRTTTVLTAAGGNSDKLDLELLNYAEVEESSSALPLNPSSSSSLLLLPDHDYAVEPTTGVSVSYYDDLNFIATSTAPPNFLIGTPANNQSTLAHIFGTFTLDPSYYSVSVYDDDWDPITQSHNVQHINSLVTASSSTARTSGGKAGSNERFWEADATWVIIVIIFPILLLIGTLGNLLTYIVLHRKTFTDKTAASWLFKCLAVMCTICLWVGLPRHWLRAVFGIDIRQLHFLSCQFHRFTLYCAMDITTWIIVSISADRLVAVLLPFKAHYISTPQNAKRVVIGLCVFFAVFNAHIFFTYGRKYVAKNVVSNASLTTTWSNPHPTTWPSFTQQFSADYVVDVSLASTSPNNATLLPWTTAAPPPVVTIPVIVSECQERDIAEILYYNRVVHPWMSFAMYVIGPFFFMLSSSVIIARKLAQRKAFLKRATSKSSTLKPTSALASLIQAQQKFGTQVRVTHSVSTRQTSSVTEITKPLTEALNKAASNSVQRSTTMLLFAASIEFLLTATPAFFLDIAEKPLKQSGIFSSPQGMARFQLLYTMVRLLLFSNFALHFFLFCLSAHRFRREVLKTLCCCGWSTFIQFRESFTSMNNPRDSSATLKRRSDNPDLTPSFTDDEPPTRARVVASSITRWLSSLRRSTRKRQSQISASYSGVGFCNGERLANGSKNTLLAAANSFRLVDETTNSERVQPTPKTSNSTMRLTTTDDSGQTDDRRLAPPMVHRSEEVSHHSDVSHDFMHVSSNTPLTLSSTGCQTMATSTDNGHLSSNDFIMSGGNLSHGEQDEHDDGCYSFRGCGGGVFSTSTRRVNSSDADDEEILSPVYKASSALAKIPPPPAVYVSMADAVSLSMSSNVRSPDASLSVPLSRPKNYLPIHAASNDYIDLEDPFTIVENPLFDMFDDECLEDELDDISDLCGESVASLGNTTVSELGDDELRLELFRNYKGGLKTSTSKSYFLPNEPPLLVSVINNEASESGSLTSTSIGDPMTRGPSLRLMYPPLAKIESDFFKAQSRCGSVSSSHSQSQPRPLFRLSDSSLKTRLVENQHRRLHAASSTGCCPPPSTNADFIDNSGPQHNRTMSERRHRFQHRQTQSYYCYPDDNRHAKIFSSIKNRRNNRKRSIVYVYLQDPTFV